MLAKEGLRWSALSGNRSTVKAGGTRPRRRRFRYASAMFIPFGTDRSTGRVPVVVPALVGLNLAIAFGLWFLGRRGQVDTAWIYEMGALSARDMRWWQPFTYQFLHDRGSIFHVLGNCVFLWAFGAVVEGRLGRVGVLLVYLAGGALAGLLQVAIAGRPCIGASGSVSVVAGLFLALHPRGTVHGYWLLPPMRMAIPAVWLLGLYAAIDVVDTLLDGFGLTRSGVGTIAHLGGLVFGLASGVLLVALGFIPRNDFDLFFLIKQWRRRRELREAALAAGAGGAQGVVAARVRSDAAGSESPRERTLRATIASAHRERDLRLSADLYAELLALNPEATLPAGIQLDVANELASRGSDRAAARAYRNFLGRFRQHPSVEDAMLMLAAIHLRRLGEPGEARPLLDALAARGVSDERRALLEALRSESGAAATRTSA